jgi:hypothetical protein
MLPSISSGGSVPGSGRWRRLEQQQHHNHRHKYLTQDQPNSVVPGIAELLTTPRFKCWLNGDREF